MIWHFCELHQYYVFLTVYNSIELCEGEGVLSKVAFSQSSMRRRHYHVDRENVRYAVHIYGLL